MRGFGCAFFVNGGIIYTMETELKELKLKEKKYTHFTAVLGTLSSLAVYIPFFPLVSDYFDESLKTLFFIIAALSAIGCIVSLIFISKTSKRIKELSSKLPANKKNKSQAQAPKFPFTIHGARGRSIEIFENKCIITTDVTLGSILTKNATDGSKTIYYSDVIGFQFKEALVTIGYLQLETAGMTMNNAGSNFFNENSFTFENTPLPAPYGDMNNYMRKIADYIQKRVEYYKPTSNNTQTVQVDKLSSADELRKYKALLDDGIITQEEFETKKKELLNS